MTTTISILPIALPEEALMSARRLAIAVVGAVLVLGSPTAALASGSGTVHSTAHAHAHRHDPITTLIPRSGVTMLKLDEATAKVLADNAIHVQPASEARNSPSGIEFPIVGGRITAQTVAGRINHVGGLTFAAGGKELTVRDFVIETTHGRLTAYVDEVGARIPLLNLHLSDATIDATKTRLSVSHVPATLTKRAAHALDGYFGTSLFTSGLSIGTARVSARILTVKA